MFLIVCATCLSTSLNAQEYYGQELPGASPEIFASGIISTGLKERDITISPDGTEIYYTTYKDGFDGNIYFVKLVEGTWSLPAIAPFSGNKEDLEPAFAPDGNKLFFASKRNTGNYDIWYVEKEANGEWSSPQDVGSPVNTSANEFYPSIANDGSLYYTAAYSNGVGGEDIWYSKFSDGAYQSPVPVLGVSTSQDEFNAFVDPNEQYIYFGSFGRADGFGGGDIYISRKVNGAWSAGTNLGSLVNSNRLDFSPFVSPDGRNLFFTSEKGVSFGNSGNPFDLKAVIDSWLQPRSSGSDIYWIKR